MKRRLNHTKISHGCVWLLVTSLLLPVHAFADGSDDFNDNNKDTSKWGGDLQTALGQLKEQNQHLEFTVSNPLSDGETYRGWNLEWFPYTNDWEIQMDCFNTTNPSFDPQVDSFGFEIVSPKTSDSFVYVELYASAIGGGPARRGFASETYTDDNFVANPDSSDLGVTHGAVRMAFDSTTKVITVYYDTDETDGYQWTEFGSVGIAGAGGTDANTDWGLSDTDQFSVYVYGYSLAMTISNGEMYGDNFMETGGVGSSGGPGPVPVPTGEWMFMFPTNNPLLTAIASISGNYTGIDPFGSGRNYDIDVAQDDSGKVASMGTIDGVANSEGGGELSGPSGAIKTVDNKPELQLKGSFSGMGDGAPVSGSGTTTAAVEFTDIGGGSNGVAATTSGSGNANGVPVSANNMPVVIPATEDMENNFSKSWILDLKIESKMIKGKETLVASGTLTLPNGDMIEFPEKKTKYKEGKGFKVSLKKGMNVSMEPPTISKKTKISIKGMTMMQDESKEWHPTGGTFQGQFLGQRTGGDLLDLTGP